MDDSKAKFDSLVGEWLARRNELETEQDARLNMIDVLLTDILGWSKGEISAGPHVHSGYADYVLKAQSRNRLVVEAKRAGKLLIDTQSGSVAAYRVNGPALKLAADGLDQARRYCVDTGVQFAALTNGFEWIGYWAVRTDGNPPKEGKAIVFPGLNAIQDNFAEFYDLFSRQGLLERLYLVRINRREGLVVRLAEKFASVVEPNEIKLLQKSSLSKDLEAVFREFFSTISSEEDLEMLSHCFVESRESREADVSLAKIAENLINRVDIVKSQKGDELESHLRAAVESNKGEFVLIIGSKGAGKSTFIDRFFRLVVDRNLRKRCLLVRVDLADSDGNSERIAGWLTERLIREIESGLFEKGFPEYRELQGIFYSEYQRWRFGEHKFLYERDRQEFKEKFGQYVAELIADQRSKYIELLLQHAVTARKLMPCIIFDNTDHFAQRFQEQVFQFAQSIHRAVLSFIICPITDRTIWQLSKSGPFQSYYSTAFYLPVPSTKEVLQKRISYLQAKLGDSHGGDSGKYFLSKGIRLNIRDLQAFAACIDEVFIRMDYISRIVGWLSNHDIRRSLNIFQRIILSPIIEISDLVKMYISSGQPRVERRRIFQALFHGDYSQFNQGSSNYVLNMFSVDPEWLSSPLCKLSVVRLLLDKEHESTERDSGYLTVEEIQNYFEPVGIPRDKIMPVVDSLLQYRLIEPYDPSETTVTENLRVRVTHSGQIHYEFAMKNFVYMQSMALCTAIRSSSAIQDMKSLLQNRGKLARQDWKMIRSHFIEAMLSEDATFLTVPNAVEYKSQHVMRDDLRNKWVVPLPS